MATKKNSLISSRRYRLQTLISRLIDPPFVLAFMTFLTVVKSGLTNRGIFAFGLFVPFLFGLPLAFFVWKIRTHQVSNWDITNRKERIIPLLFFLIFLIVDIIGVSLFDNPLLLNIFVLYFLWVLGFFLVTLFWKISGHTGMITLAVGLLVYWFGYWALPSLVLIPLVAWARVSRKDHSLLQALAGIIYSLLILQVWNQLFPHSFY